MPSLVQLPPEILAQIYTELLTNDDKEFWPQLRETNRSCFEAETANDSWTNGGWPCARLSPVTRPCEGEVDPTIPYNATSPSDTTDEDEDDDRSQDEDASEDEDTSDDEIAWITNPNHPDFFPPMFIERVAPPPQQYPPLQHRQCTNHYFLHPAILATSSFINAGASAVLYGRNAFHFALDFDESGDGLSNAPWAKHLDKIRDIHLTQNCDILGRARPRQVKIRRDAMWDAFPDRDHWGDREFREDLCSIINSLLLFNNLQTRFQRLRLDLGNVVPCHKKDGVKIQGAPSTAVLFDQLAKGFALLNVVQQIDIRVTARAMQSEKWKRFAGNVAKSMKGHLQIIEEDLEDGESVRADEYCNTRFVIGPQGMEEGNEVAEL